MPPRNEVAPPPAGPRAARRALRRRIAAPACLLAIMMLGLGCGARRRVMNRYPALEPGTLWGALVDREHTGRAPPAAAMRDDILDHWSGRPLGEAPASWRQKVVPPRALMARLETGRDIDCVNLYLQTMRPWSASGSEWDVREAWGWRKSYQDRIRIGHRGDYDFTQSVLVAILYRYGHRPHILYPATVDHIINRLIIDQGPGPRAHVPRSLGLVPETENHILMTESARYLANQWRRRHGDADPRYDNQANGLAQWLGDLLEAILRGGFHEFNSMPYQGYALQPVINLADYAGCPRLAGLSRRILDAELWRFAFASLAYRRCAPFRRDIRNAGETDLANDRFTPMAAVWSAAGIDDLPPGLRAPVRRSPFALDAAAADYAPPVAAADLLRGHARGAYFVRMGRGPRASPEIYSGGPNFLLSAGGVAPPRTREVAVRPITLLLNDGVHDLRKCFHIPAAANANRTGVYHRFACGDRPVHVPEQFNAVVADGHWRIFRPLPGQSLLVAVYNRDRLGLLAVMPDEGLAPETLLARLRQHNPDGHLARRFVFPDGRTVLSYDPAAPSTLWVMRAVDDRSLDRDYTQWPLLTGVWEDGTFDL